MAATTRQKVLLVLVILAFAYAAWQAYQLFFQDRVDAEPATPKIEVKQAVPRQEVTTTPTTPDQTTRIPAITTTPNETTSTTTPTLTAPTTTPTTPTTTTPAPNTQATPTTERKVSPSYQQRQTDLAAVATTNAMPADTPLQLKQLAAKKGLTSAQREYLHLVEQYQIAKLRRQVAEEEAAIAETQAKIAETRAKTRTILGTGATTEMGPGFRAITPYQLMYVDYQKGRWTANLAHDGIYHEVKVGSILPDGTRVVSINKQRVLLRKDGQMIYLSFTSARYIKSRREDVSAIDSQPMQPTTAEMAEHNTPSAHTSTIAAATTAATQKTDIQTLASTKTLAALTTPLAASKPAAIQAVTTTARSQPKDNALAQRLAEDNFLTINPHSQENTPTDQAHEPATTKQTVVKPTPVKPSANPLVRLTARSATASPNKTTPTTPSVSALSKAKKRYAVQLMGGFSAAEVEHYAQLERIQDKTKVVKTQYKGRAWYVLLYGDYPTVAAAEGALKQLPKTLKQSGAWVRRVPVQRTVDRGQKTVQQG